MYTYIPTTIKKKNWVDMSELRAEITPFSLKFCVLFPLWKDYILIKCRVNINSYNTFSLKQVGYFLTGELCAGAGSKRPHKGQQAWRIQPTLPSTASKLWTTIHFPKYFFQCLGCFTFFFFPLNSASKTPEQL